MKTVLIGFKINVGTMDRDGKQVPYNSRTVRFITDMGAGDDDIGFTPFEAKFKLEDIAKVLGVNPNNNDVNEALSICVNKAVVCQYAPVYGKLECVGFKLDK